MKFEDSKTKQNLSLALQGEALAHLKYQFYRSKIADISKELEQEFDEIIHNEKEHGKIWFKYLHNGEVPDNEVNLLDAISGEMHEFSEMYPKFSEEAYDEGFDEIGELFLRVSKIEGQHAKKFKKMKEEIENDSLFKGERRWKCLNCGYTLDTTDALQECPVCKHPQKYFKQI